MSDEQNFTPQVGPVRETMKADTVGPAPLRGTWYELLPVMPEHEGFLYGLATDDSTGYRWRYRGSIPSAETFQAQVWQNILVQFVIADRKTSELVGHVVAYNADLHAGFMYFGIVTAEETAGRGAVLEAGALFIHYLFHTYNIRKIYFEVPEFNVVQFGSGLGRVFEEEGRLRRHSFYGGRHWDELIFALYREQAMQLPGIRRVTRAAKAGMDDGGGQEHRGDADEGVNGVVR